MTVNKVPVGLNMPFALKPIVDGGNEIAHTNLPPYHRRKAFLVDEYPACPKDWLRSTGRTKSYFVPIIEGSGLWLDFNATRSLDHHVAAIVSVQGVNAVTGLPAKDGAMEQFKDECPRHKKAFGPDRYCKECDYRWPKQNYVSSTGQPAGQMWIDGFRAENGVIRQYVLTASKIHGVAANLVGEDRVFALGISLFLSKEKRYVLDSVMRGRSLMSFAPSSSDEPEWGGMVACAGAGGGSAAAAPIDSMESMDMTMYEKSVEGPVGDSGPEGPPGASIMYSHTLGSSIVSHKLMDTGAKGRPMSASAKMERSATYSATLSSPKVSAKTVDESSYPMKGRNAAPVKSRAPVSPVSVKKLEIGAGARVDQEIHDDPNGLDFWQAEPEGLIIINYCSEEEARKIIAAGKIDLSGDKEGFLKNIPKPVEA